MTGLFRYSGLRPFRMQYVKQFSPYIVSVVRKKEKKDVLF